MTKSNKKENRLAPGSRLTIAPTPAMMKLLGHRWPVRISRHALMQLALRVGLEDLSALAPETFRDLVLEEIKRALEICPATEP